MNRMNDSALDQVSVFGSDAVLGNRSKDRRENSVET